MIATALGLRYTGSNLVLVCDQNEKVRILDLSYSSFGFYVFGLFFTFSTIVSACLVIV